MANNSTRRGLAWAAAGSLIASLFGAMPAVADANISLAPIAGTSTATLVDQEFTLVASTLNATSDASVGKLSYKIDKLSSVGQVEWSADSTTSDDIAAANSGNKIAAGTTSYVVIPSSSAAVAGKKNIFSLKLSNATTVSASVDVTVTAFIDNDLDGVLDSGEANESVTVSFKKYSDVTASVSFPDVTVGDTTAKFSISVSGINLEQLGTNPFYVAVGKTASATVAASRALANSVSVTLSSSGVVTGDSVSAQIQFGNNASGYELGAKVTKIVNARTITAVTMSAVTGNNVVASGSQSVSARVNSAFELNIRTVTNSTAVASVPVNVTMTATGVTLSSTKYVVVNGTTVTASPGASGVDIDVTTGADGSVKLSVSTVGFVDGEAFSFSAKAQNLTTTLGVTTYTPKFTVSSDNGASTLINLGGTAALSFSVKDQWGALSARTNQRLNFTLTNGTGLTSKLDAVAVSSGKAAASLAATPTTVSGTVQVWARLQAADQDTGIYSNLSGATDVTVSVIISSSAPVFATKPVASYSASISYGAAMSWSSVAAGAIKVSLGGASVVVSGTDVIFEYNSKTTSGTVTLPAAANGDLPAFKMASRKAGSHTVSFTVGSTTSTALLNVDAALFSAGKNIAVSTNYIDADAATQVTVTLTDDNGNPVQVTGGVTGSVEIDYVSNKGGALLGTIAGTTNAKGQFSFTILTGGNDNGTGTLTVTYNKNGTATAAKDVISKAFTMTVGKAPVAAVEGKLTVGSFKGFVAIYASGYEGKKLTAKVAGKWISVASLKSFERVVRKTGAGYSIKVDLYIDGSLVKSETVTTK